MLMIPSQRNWRQLACLRRVLAIAGSGLLCTNTVDAPAQADTTSRASCVSSSGFGLDQALARTRLHLTHGRTLTIVAIGSSSTQGTGSSSPGATYPSRLELLLRERFPDVTVRVLNRGIGGEEEADMLARFERDVIAAWPDLVLWQVASNAIIRHRPLSAELMLIRKGIARLKRTGADVILVDPQYTTAVLAQAIAVPMVELISAEAHRQQVGVFKRFELMKDWHENQHLPFEAFSVPDGLHMNDWGYDCLARNLAAAITASVMPAEIASAPIER
jgi:lysophospholipase L1-like esterase